MRLSGLILGAVLFILPGVGAAASSRVHGVVADESGGVLPGVTVEAAAEDGSILATSVTDAVGRYAFRELPATVRLTFQLEGFAPAAVNVTTKPGVELALATQRLKLAPTSETVEVRGEVRAVAPAPPPPPRVEAPPPRPRPILKSVPVHDAYSICGPAKPEETKESFGTIRAGHSVKGNGLFGAGDELMIAGGTPTGLTVGQNLVARRAYRTSADAHGVAGEHTAGLLQIVAAGPSEATAVVIYACDEIVAGDWLAPFSPEPIRAPEPAGLPAYDRAARILLTDAGQLIGAPNRLMVIDQGRDNGIRVGQRLTLFRPRQRGPDVIGDAVVVAVRMDSATIRVQRATDVIAPGDSAAPQRP
jgi:hypothetical protein